MTVQIHVISQQPPGGRCTLYAGYADVLERHLGARTTLVLSTTRDAHGEGFPCLRVNDVAIQPEDGVIIMPADILTALAMHGFDSDAIMGLAEALEAPLERMLESES